VWEGDTVLDGALPVAHLRFPKRILTAAQQAATLADKQINEASASGLEVMVNASCAPDRDALQSPTHVRLSQVALQLGPTLIVELIDGLQ
jgi:hypothetical protein